MSLMAGWERLEFAPGGGDAFLSYVVFGVVPETVRLPRVAADVPNLAIRRFTAAEHGETMRAFLEGPDMRRLDAENPELAELTRAVPECALVSAAVEDPPDLLYLRRIRHVVAALLSAGGRALLDGPTLSWWRPDAWRSNILAPAELSIHAEVVLNITGTDRLWVRTRGMRKFGRPDISIGGVPAPERPAAVEHCRELIASMIAGRRLDGASGSLEDPEFNNTHVNVAWPAERR